jgi:hypothetical protein
MDTPRVPCKFWIKMIQSVPSLGIPRMRHNIDIFSITYPFLVTPHLLHCFFAQEQPFQPWCDRYITKLFDHHFCGDRCSIFVYHLHLFGPTAMHTFGVVLVLLPKQHAFFYMHQSSRSSFQDRTQSSWTDISLLACYASLG